MLPLNQKKIRIAVIMGNAVLTKAVLIVGGGWLGSVLDEKWGTKPWMLFLGLVLGMACGVWYILVLANRFNKNDKN